MEIIGKREASNKDKLVGQKPPLKPKDIWAIRIYLQNAHAVRDLAMFNLAIGSKLGGCDLVRPSSTRRRMDSGYSLGHGDPEKNSAAGAVRADGADESRSCCLVGEGSASR